MPRARSFAVYDEGAALALEGHDISEDRIAQAEQVRRAPAPQPRSRLRSAGPPSSRRTKAGQDSPSTSARCR